MTTPPTGRAPNLDLVFVTHTAVGYGASRSMAVLIDGCDDRRRVGLVGPPGTGEMAGKLGLAPDAVLEVSLPWSRLHPWEIRPGKRLKQLRHAWSTYRKLRRFVRSGRPSVVCSNSSVFEWGHVAAAACGAKHVWFLREFGDLDYQLQWSEGSQPRFERRVKQADRIVSVSRAVAEHHGVADQPQACVLYNGVAARDQMIDRGPAQGPAASRHRLGVVGLVCEAKCIEIAVEAIGLLHRQGHRGASLHIYGDGPDDYRQRLRDLAAERSVADAVVFEGYRERVADIYGSIDATVVAARHEAFGRTTAEAMAYGVPVVGRASGGTIELIDNGRSGLLFDGSPADLASQIARLIDEPGLASRLAAAGQQRARREFSHESYSAGFETILNELAA
ncbi:MAG: glycosyltransferase family 4 protein [Planctomycetota bacterium]